MRERHVLVLMHAPDCPCKNPGKKYADAYGPVLKISRVVMEVEVEEVTP